MGNQAVKQIENRNEKIISCQGKLNYKSISRIFGISYNNVKTIMSEHGLKLPVKSYSSKNI